MNAVSEAEAKYNTSGAAEVRAPSDVVSAGARRRVHKGARAVFLVLLFLAAAASMFVIRLVGGELSLSGFTRTLNIFAGQGGNAVFVFEDGFDEVFADLGGAVVSAGKSGVAVYAKTGEELSRESFAMANPAIISGGALAIAYDAGGRGVRIADRSGIVASMTLDSGVVSCAAGRGGIFAVTTRASGEYKGRVEFFAMRSGVPEKIYDWYSGEGPVLGAAISRSGKRFAALTLTARGGRIVLLERGSTTPTGEYVYENGAIFEMAFTASGALLARAGDALISISESGAGEVIFAFNGHKPDGYATGDSFAALHLTGPAGGELVTVDERGVVLGRIETSRGLIWLSAEGDRVAVLRSDGLDIYDRELRLAASYPEASGASNAFPRGGKSAVVTGAREGRAFNGQDS
ncbi:MAG: DUF5711 family protein [Oscillospiraceae bacterium]|jgi:hypothetical protein|nr:DUF5711 family protein [Oscillospiraceae bacterium]